MGGYDYEAQGGPAMPTLELLDAYLRALRIHDSRWLTVPRRLGVAAPAAGADWTTSTPAGTTFVPLAINATLTTSATVANRGSAIVIGDGNATLVTIAAAAVQTAATAFPLSYFRGFGTVASSVFSTGVNAPLPMFPLTGGSTVASSTQNLQAGDQWSAISLYGLVLRERTMQELARYMEDLDAGAHTELYPGFPIGL